MVTKNIFDKVLRRLTFGTLEVDYWGTDTRVYGHGEPKAHVLIKNKQVLTNILRRFDLGFGEAYMDQLIEVDEKSLLNLLAISNLNKDMFVPGVGKNFGRRMSYRYEHNAKPNQKRQIQSHYDVGNDFYRLWLDDTMTYTCAYYKTPKDTLEQAQRQKIDHVLRKLRLEKGHEFVDIGCGWGHLVVRAAKLYGAKGLGVTLSKEQYEFATELAKREGVSDLAKFKQMNYQDLLPSDKQYDRVISVGIFEHVGRGNHDQYFEVVDKLLKPGGVSVLHSITQQKENLMPAWIDKYIFPGGYIPSLRETIWKIPDYGFRLTDVENLRPHYALTLLEWLRRFEEHLPEIRTMGYDERFIRMWRLYLVGSINSFANGGNDLSQIVFTKGINDDIPLTREYLYKTK
jgi:cyclopropane-fatty-acyl-phospholipid synthase